ncbi:hypothetical protein TSL1_05240 [Sulfurovum sp. TSL1]|nr:hypothetical protein TSL1_05240 [Sulfurovum sp. TSL1]
MKKFDEERLKKEAFEKPYNLTYFIRLFAVATFAGYKFSSINRKPYKMFYIGGFIMKLDLMKIFLSN